MHLVMFDIDGTLVDSSDFEDELYCQAIQSVINVSFNRDWSTYRHTSDSGILNEIIEKNHLEKGAFEIHKKVKKAFIKLTGSYLKKQPVLEIKGAAAFIEDLKTRKNICLAIATGGWQETAKLKLQSAGIDIDGMSFSSSSDHISRIDIMKQAELNCGENDFLSKTYFGDAVWDKIACAQLDYNFILVGNQIKHENQIDDFAAVEDVIQRAKLDAD